MPFRDAITSAERVAAAKAASQFVVPPDPTLLKFCREAAEHTRSQMSFVTFVYEETHHVVADFGFNPVDNIIKPGETDGTWSASLCAYVVASGSPMTFHDTNESPLLENCLAIGKVRSYSGAPLFFRGQVVGAMGVADTRPRTVTARQLRRLIKLADKVSKELKEREF